MIESVSYFLNVTVTTILAYIALGALSIAVLGFATVLVLSPFLDYKESTNDTQKTNG